MDSKLLLSLLYIKYINGDPWGIDDDGICTHGSKYLYHSFDDVISWHDAELFCQKQYGTHLASIHSQKDFESSQYLCLV